MPDPSMGEHSQTASVMDRSLHEEKALVGEALDRPNAVEMAKARSNAAHQEGIAQAVTREVRNSSHMKQALDTSACSKERALLASLHCRRSFGGAPGRCETRKSTK